MILVKCPHSRHREIEAQRKEKDLPPAARVLGCLFHHQDQPGVLVKMLTLRRHLRPMR